MLLCTVSRAQEEVRPAEPATTFEFATPAAATAPGTPAPAEEKSPEEAVPEVAPPSADELYHLGVAEIDRASKLERKGKREEAINAYEHAGQLCQQSISLFDRDAVAESERPLDLYFRAATSFLHAGRLLAAEKKADADRKDEDLRLAITYLENVEKLEKDRAERNHTAVNPEIWRVHNAAGYACFLRGELARARTHYQAVLLMNPTYKPAKDAVAKINELERRENEIFSPQGRTLDHEKKMKAARGVVDALKLVRDIVKLGL